MTLAINDGDFIVTAWADRPEGPGWSNRLVWVLIRNRTGELREEAIQYEDMTRDMQVLHETSAIAARQMTLFVRTESMKRKLP